jgi:hypothetical protein
MSQGVSGCAAHEVGGRTMSALSPTPESRPLTPKEMTLDRARQLLKVQADFGGFYNANSAKLILSEVQKEHGQESVDSLIRELELQRIFGFEPGTRFEGGLVVGKQ